MTRVSTAEMYDDKDVITQICKLKDGLNAALGGIISDIDVVNGDLVIEWADGESISLPLPAPIEITGISASVIGGNLSITLLMSDGSSHTVVTPLTNLMTTDSQQTITAKKIFSADVEAPTTPAGDDSAVNSFYVNDSTGTVVNNIAHKDGDETIDGVKTIEGLVATPLLKEWINASTTGGSYMRICGVVKTSGMLDFDLSGLGVNGRLSVMVTGVTNYGLLTVYNYYTNTISDIEAFTIENVMTGLMEIWVRLAPGRRCYWQPRMMTFNNIGQPITVLTKYGTVQAADPSLDTATYTNKISLKTLVVEV